MAFKPIGPEHIMDDRKYKLLSLFQKYQGEGCGYCGGGEGDVYVPEETWWNLIRDILLEFPEK